MTTTILIIIATCIVSFLGFKNYAIFDQLKHFPSIEHQDKSYYRWLTGGFLHGDEMHLFVNMYVFYMFGTYVEYFIKSSSYAQFGSIIFLVLYLLIIAMANIPTYFKYKNSTFFSSVGASGGVTGLVFIYILLNPWEMLYLFLQFLSQQYCLECFTCGIRVGLLIKTGITLIIMAIFLEH
ncbi:MAG: rhomboid family intramembrane serine protease [Saprospiraceae bacterium]